MHRSLAVRVLSLLLAFALQAPPALAMRAVPTAPVPAPAALVFPASPQQVLDLYLEAQAAYSLELDRIAALPRESRDFENTVRALDLAGAEFSDRITPLLFLKQVSADPELRTAAKLVREDSEAFGLRIAQRLDLYEAVKAAADAGELLAVDDRRLLEAALRGYREAGLELPPEERARLLRWQERLAALASEFETNISKAEEGLVLAREDLAGLPEDYLGRLDRTDDGRWKVSLKYPDYFPFMEHSERADLRKELQLRFRSRGAPRNVELLAEALRLRDDSARLLGHASHPHRVLAGRMAKEPGRVEAFLQKLWNVLRPRGEADLAELLEGKRREEPGAAAVEPHEHAYLTNKLRKERYDVDPEEVRRYFPVERVVEGTLRVYQRVLGVVFEEDADAPRWHPDARAFAVRDAADGRRIGRFYLDLHPREGKYSHAAAFHLATGRELPGGSTVEPAAAMVTNFTKPTAEAPSLLDLGEVETFFHEFGHLMHHVLSRARHASQSGFNVAWDFVEAPSQMMEHFVWEPEVLDEISGHVEDPSRKLPEELRRRLLRARSFQKGLYYLFYLAQSLADLTLHAAVPARPSALFNRVMELAGLVPVPEGAHPVAGFGHLMGGYDAGYWGYLWSEVFADDLFARFRREGVLNPAVGAAYRRAILETGASRPEEESLREFLGRDPDPAAFIERLSPPREAAPAG